MEHNKTQKYIKLFQVALAAAAVYFVLKYLLPIVLPFVIAFFLCRIFYPWAEKMEKKTRVPITVWSIVFVGGFAAVILAILGFGIYYGGNYLQVFLKNTSSITIWTENFLNQICKSVADISGTDQNVVHQWFLERGPKFLENIQKDLPGKMAGFCVTFVKGLGKAFIVLFIALVGTVLLMKNKRRIKKQIAKNIFASEITGMVTRICEVSAGFFKCQGIIIAVIAVVLSVGLRLMGNSYGILIGIVVAVLDALPVIGSGTVLLPWALLSVFMGNYKQAVILIILYGICTVIREVLEPRLMGDKLGINEFYMLMATFIGISLFGVWGIFLGPLGMIMILEILRQMEDLYS